MSASKTKIYKGQKGKKDIRYFDPALLKVVEDEKDPRFDPRSKRPIDETMVLSIMLLLIDVILGKKKADKFDEASKLGQAAFVAQEQK